MTTEEIKQQTEQYVLHTYNRFPIVIEKGEGDFVYDTDGKKYLDFGAGIAVFALGYHFPGFDEALKAQIDRVIHTSNLYYHAAFAILLSAVLALSAAGCGSTDEKTVSTATVLYYMDKDELGITSVQYTPQKQEQSEIEAELLAKLQEAPANSSLEKLLPDDVKVNSSAIEKGVLHLDFSASYKNMHRRTAASGSRSGKKIRILPFRCWTAAPACRRKSAAGCSRNT